MNTGMRERQVWILHPQVIVEEQVEVDASRAPPYRWGYAPHGLLDALKLRQQFTRRQLREHASRSIHECRLILWPHWTTRIERRTDNTLRARYAGKSRKGDLDLSFGAVEIAAQRDVGWHPAHHQTLTWAKSCGAADDDGAVVAPQMHEERRRLASPWPRDPQPRRPVPRSTIWRSPHPPRRPWRVVAASHRPHESADDEAATAPSCPRGDGNAAAT